LRISLIGAGRVAAHLGLALQAIGRAPTLLGARDAAKALPLADRLGLSVCNPVAAMDADAVFLCVRDEAIAPLAAALPWQGQLAVHLSGATPLDALQPAAHRAGFHPLQLFASPLPRAEDALAAFQGVRIGIEADEPARLMALARALGAVPLALEGAQRTRYHAAANLGASGLLAPLHEACTQWAAVMGVSDAEAWAALQPLAAGTLRAAGARGLVGALSGPLARGDVAVLAAHLAVLPDARFYRQLMAALLPLAEQGGRLDASQTAALRALLRD
jgi:predicted short-subunit dehydrogenase-like oxidoreductase (DUF2520 family)